MKAVEGYFLSKSEDLDWRPSNMMKIPNADFLERIRLRQGFGATGRAES